MTTVLRPITLERLAAFCDETPRGFYLLHFSEPFGHAKHYGGYSKNIIERIRLHQKGQGANLTKHVVAAGITLELVGILENADRTAEHNIKYLPNGQRRGSLARICPLCKAQKGQRT